MARYEATTIKTPTGKWICVGSVPLHLVSTVYETKRDAEADLRSALFLAEVLEIRAQIEEERP